MIVMAAVTLPVLAGLAMALWSFGRDEPVFYTPGVTQTREDCVYARMKTYARVDRQILHGIAQDCELTVQSIEGHEGMRKAWEARQAARTAEPRPADAAAPAPEAAPAEGDRVRRVWR